MSNIKHGIPHSEGCKHFPPFFTKAGSHRIANGRLNHSTFDKDYPFVGPINQEAARFSAEIFEIIPAGPGRMHCLRVPPDKPEAEGDISVIEEAAEEPEPEDEAFILCRQCHQAITRPADRIAVQGAHRHTFANPHGIVFEIGCFRNVEGCGYAGAASDEFTWFAGYSWRVCFCRMCLTHLGWVFNSRGGHVFHGLILDRLIEPD